MWTEHTEYEEYHKLQLSTVLRYQQNNTLGKISPNYRYRKKFKKISISFFFSISHIPTLRGKKQNADYTGHTWCCDPDRGEFNSRSPVIQGLKQKYFDWKSFLGQTPFHSHTCHTLSLRAVFFFL